MSVLVRLVERRTTRVIYSASLLVHFIVVTYRARIDVFRSVCLCLVWARRLALQLQKTTQYFIRLKLPV